MWQQDKGEVMEQFKPFMARFTPSTDLISKEQAVRLLGKELLAVSESEIKDIRVTQVTTELTGRVKTTSIELKNGTEVYLGTKNREYILWD